MFDFIALRLIRQFVTHGSLTITTSWGATTICEGTREGPTSVILITDRATLLRLVIRPDLEFGEAYMDGRLTISQGGIESLVELLVLNKAHWGQHWIGRITGGIRQAAAFLNQLNFRSRSRRNVAHHYDLTDQLFDSFLDPSRQYSCAYFHCDADTLESAQITKIARLAAKLDLKPGDRVLDIGCGWGGLSRALALCGHGTHVTGITLSNNQLAYARQAATHAGLTERLSYHLRDYRDQTGSFDKVVSIGMLEHVGPHHYPSYFKQIRQVLTPQGVAVIHTIAVHHRAGPVNRWITKYIFPGGYLPSIQEIVGAAERQGLKLLDMEVLRGHYATTLKHWRHRFMSQKDVMTRLYDARFVRMWEFYLVGCEYFFRCQRGMVIQVVLSTDHTSIPSSRRYITDREKEFRSILCQISPSGNANPSPK